MHSMSLVNEPFEKIKSGKKQIEMRLFDEKRKKIKIDDYIEFTNKDTLEKIKVKVVNMYLFPNFEELYNFFDKTKLGYEEKEQANYKDMARFYQDEEIKKYGVVGIEIELV